MTTPSTRRWLVPAIVAAVTVAVAAPVAWALAARGQDAEAGGLAPASPPPTAAAGGPPSLDETPVASTPQIPVQDASLEALRAEPAVAPARVEVASVGISAEVDQVGVAADGQMELPPDPDRTGWYRFGAAPGGTQGSAVLAAHVDSRRYGIGQFARLRDVAPGDRVVVTLADGRRLEHDVVDVRNESKQAVRLDSLFRRDGEPALVLVTCGGAYVPDAGGYEDNVIVTAVPLGPAP